LLKRARLAKQTRLVETFFTYGTGLAAENVIFRRRQRFVLVQMKTRGRRSRSAALSAFRGGGDSLRPRVWRDHAFQLHLALRAHHFFFPLFFFSGEKYLSSSEKKRIIDTQ
jgi:hypothetical protein